MRKETQEYVKKRKEEYVKKRTRNMSKETQKHFRNLAIHVLEQCCMCIAHVKRELQVCRKRSINMSKETQEYVIRDLGICPTRPRNISGISPYMFSSSAVCASHVSKENFKYVERDLEICQKDCEICRKRPRNISAISLCMLSRSLLTYLAIFGHFEVFFDIFVNLFSQKHFSDLVVHALEQRCTCIARVKRDQGICQKRSRNMSKETQTYFSDLVVHDLEQCCTCIARVKQDTSEKSQKRPRNV